MLRCSKCKYQDLPPDETFASSPRGWSEGLPEPDARNAIMRFGLRLKAQMAYNQTPEAQGFSCHQCGRDFELDDVRWEGDSYEMTWSGKYVRKEPRQIRTIRTAMYIRADNGNRAARIYLAERWVLDSEWKGFAAKDHEEFMARVTAEMEKEKENA